jgi:hypothetical protein
MSDIDERDTRYGSTEEYAEGGHAATGGVEDEQVGPYGEEDVEGSEVQYVPLTADQESDFATDVDVDSTEGSDDEVEEVDAPAETKDKPKAKAEDKSAKRGDLPEDYTTPVGLAKIITERGLYTTREGVVAELKPQMVYSYAKNAPKDNPFPAETIEDSNGNPRNAVKIEAGVDWWIKKNERAKERRDNAAAKLSDKAKAAAAKAEGATEAEGTADDTEPATEAE